MVLLGSRALVLPESVVGFDIVDQIPSTSSGDRAILMHPHVVVRIPSLATELKGPFTICVLRTQSCSIITNTPGFYTSPPPRNLTDEVLIKKSPNMGIGLFTKRKVKVNETVFSERPLLAFPRGLPIYSPLARKELQDSMFEEMLQQALRAMTKEDSDAFMSLHSCLPHLSRVLGIVNTNAFASGIEKQNLEEGKFGYSVIGKLASRINHSCRPNVEINFDIPTFSLQLVALRNIEAGQQLFYSYSNYYRSAKERQRELLTGYAFVCQCEACVNATPERDKLREEMNDRIEKIAEEAEEMLAKPQLNLRSLDRWLELEKEIVKEGLDFGEYFVVLLFTIYKAYVKLGNIPKLREYSNRTVAIFKLRSEKDRI